MDKVLSHEFFLRQKGKIPTSPHKLQNRGTLITQCCGERFAKVFLPQLRVFSSCLGQSTKEWPLLCDTYPIILLCTDLPFPSLCLLPIIGLPISRQGQHHSVLRGSLLFYVLILISSDRVSLSSLGYAPTPS